MPQYATSEEAPGPASKGSVLVVVLVALLLVSALLLQMQLTTRSRLSRSVVEMDEARLRAAMTDAVYQALQRLADDQDLLVDHPQEAWSEKHKIKDPAGITIRVHIQDAMAWFDLNNVFQATPDLAIRPAQNVLIDLLMQCGDFTATDRVNSLRDWVDPDNEGLREADFYLENDLGYEPPNRPLQTWSELLQVNGFNRDYVRGNRQKGAEKNKPQDLFNTLTLVPVTRSQPLPVNVNTAPRHVLLGVLGLDKTGLVDTLMAMRANQPIRRLSDLDPLIDNQTMTTMQTYLDVKSAYYLVQAHANLEGITTRMRTLVHRRGNGTIEVLQWAM